MLYRLLLAYHKYYCVKCLVVSRRIFGEEYSGGGGGEYNFDFMLMIENKHTIKMLMSLMR